MRCFLLVFLALRLAALDLPPLTERTGWVLSLAGTSQQIPGELVSRDEATGTIRFRGSDGKTAVYQKSEYSRLDPPLDAAQVVTERGRLLLGDRSQDWTIEIRATMNWGRKKGADAAVRDLGIAAMAVYPKDLSLAEEVIPLLEGDPAHLDDLIRIAENGLTTNPKWLPGYRAKAAALELQGKEQELYELVRDQWLPNQVTDPVANRHLARLAEKLGRPEEATDAYRKLWKYHDDGEAALGFARASLFAGVDDDALEAARWLLDKGRDRSAAAAIAGSALLRTDQPGEALPLLQEAVDSGALSAPLATVAQHNLGVAQYAAGQREQALATWQGLDGPATDLARAIASARPVAQVAALPEALREVAQEHNICVGLADKQYASISDQLKAGDARHQFLGKVAALLESSGSVESVRALDFESTYQAEAQRWQLYGHLIASRLAEAQELVDRMPEKDGYAAVVRIYLAAADKDMDRARFLFSALDGVQAPPQDYVATLAAEFAAENDELQQIDFAEWSPGNSLRPGWGTQQEGTGVTIAVADGSLVLAGTQTPARDPVTRAWRLVPTSHLQQVTLDLDTTALAGAVGGLELLDESRTNGIAMGVTPQGTYAWRQLTQGSWSAWTDFGVGPEGGQARFTLDYNPQVGRVMAELPGGRQQALGLQAGLGSPRTVVAIFGVADPGVTWRLAAKRMSIQLRDPATQGRGGGLR